MFVTNTVQLASSALPASKKNNLNITNERKSYNSKSVSLPLPYHFTSFITISSNILCVEMHQKLIEYASTERPWVSILSRAKQNEAAHWDFLPKFPEKQTSERNYNLFVWSAVFLVKMEWPTKIIKIYWTVTVFWDIIRVCSIVAGKQRPKPIRWI